MRILHLDSGRELRGGQWQVLRLLQGLAAEGVESTLLARAGSPLFEAARKQGSHVEPLGLRRAIALARRNDLVHAHDAASHTIGAVARASRLVVSRRVAFAIRSRWKYGRARHYVAVSEFVKSVLISGGVPEEKISVVHDGVPPLEPSQGDAVMAPAYSGDLQKAAPLATEAARLAGVSLQLSSDLERDLHQAAIFLYITRSEGLGSGALMSMSAGVPVIASNVGGLPEIIRHRENGLLVENRTEEVAAALNELLADRELAQRLGAAARQTVMDRFTVDRMVRRTMEVYRQVLS
ncbi:MAG TPA: glycosyltransferase family 4 protein [Bryobacteraceae bacterium]|nr:glycosyltransferase family 4 protein [Bryobacteraceae bacterium]